MATPAVGPFGFCRDRRGDAGMTADTAEPLDRGRN
jgi:hypothetical protein